MEHDFMAGIGEKRRSTGHRGENPAFAFDAQILLHVRELCHPPYQRCGLVRIEIVTDDMPTGGLWGSGDHGLQMSEKIGLGARGSTAWGHDLATDHIPTQDEGAGAMTNILTFAAFDFSRDQRQAWMFAFERLHSCELISTYGSFSQAGQLRRLL